MQYNHGQLMALHVAAGTTTRLRSDSVTTHTTEMGVAAPGANQLTVTTSPGAPTNVTAAYTFNTVCIQRIQYIQYIQYIQDAQYRQCMIALVMQRRDTI